MAAPPDRDGPAHLYAPLSLMEQRHTEDKAWKSDHADEHRIHVEEHRALDSVLGELRHADESITTRLASGVDTFREHKKRLDELDGKINWPAWKVLTTAGAAIVFAGSLIWAAARYPTRDEYQRLQDEVTGLRLEQAKMNAKLDQALAKP